ncbi:urease accessory protein UreH domain-containing protein [Anaeromicropila herbilytica]|uniref:HMA domain-containing protein n=1 Tax=Anaeromicropila herbilytica TaxID=2785025 RepID=A0A7R7EN70_9FIRM|nr:sulfite exporter TauE/SafE family protein [Anaeromicropila herbilytica]BCN31950.1 hypothetical protein bsdtb5_32450 [Anaeromicropila herbilytica]
MNHTIIKLSGLSCPACEYKIEKEVKSLLGVEKVKVDYQTSMADVFFNPNQVTMEEIKNIIIKTGYEVITKEDEEEKVEKHSFSTTLYFGIIIFGIYIIIKNTIGFQFYPEITRNMGYGMLFIAGLFTSIHCVAMCGGINLSQCISCSGCEKEGIYHKAKPSLFYNMGRVTSYTILGGIVGTVGSVFSVNIETKAIISIAAGIFMIIMGINMLDVIPALRKLMPRLPKNLVDKIESQKSGRTPFIVGILNGFMPCGPLQAMQLYALATGSFLGGALSMFLFSLGTVPLMFLFGVISTMINSSFTKQMMKISAMLVIILGIVMSNRGLSFIGFGGIANIAPIAKEQVMDENQAVLKKGYQTITTDLESGRYQSFTVTKNVPLKWIIKADKENLNGCNGEIIVYDYKIDKVLKVGENVIEFTPTKTGNISYTCWMGMISANITVE